MANVDEDGVTFRSHLNGDIHRFTPAIRTRRADAHNNYASLAPAPNGATA